MYATANLQDRYKQDYVTTASPLDLIIMLYDGCIKQLKLSKIFEEENLQKDFLDAVEKAEEIILELIRSLNMNYEISNNLLDLYQFMLKELVETTYSKEMDRIDKVIEFMSSLRESWVEAKNTVGNSYSAEAEEE